MNLVKQLQFSLIFGLLAGLLLSCISSVDGTKDSKNPIVIGPILTPGNGWSGATSEPPATGPGPKAIARFDVDPDNLDFHPRDNSPLRERMSRLVPFDLDGHLRSNDSASVGAYE